MILNLDEMKERGEIPSDLDARISRILGLPKMCEGPLDAANNYLDFTCTACNEKNFDSSGPYPELRAVDMIGNNGAVYTAHKWFSEHLRVPFSYSSDLVASRKLLEWFLSGRNCFELSKHRNFLLAVTKHENCPKCPTILVEFTALSDGPLALAVAVEKLLGVKIDDSKTS